MNKEAAFEIIELMVEFGARLNLSVEQVQKQCSEDEFIFYRKAIGKLMGNMLLDVMNPIFKEHPDLKPSGLT